MIFRHTLLALLAFSSLGWIPARASADLLMGMYSGISGTSSDTTDVARVCIGLTAGVDCSSDPSRLVTPYLSTTGERLTFRIDATTDPIHFPVFAALATNGIADELKVVFQTPATDLIQLFDESMMFGAEGRVDYIGIRLDAIEIEVDPYFYVRPRVGQPGSDIDGGYGIRYYGTPIPEPSVAALLGLGLALMARVGRARFDRSVAA